VTRSFLYSIMLVCYMAVIFYLSSLPPKVKVGGFDFPIHIIEYIPLGILSLLWFKEKRFKNPFLFSFIFSLLYAISDEIHQLFIPGRNASIKDVVADCIGIIVGLYLVVKWRR